MMTVSGSRLRPVLARVGAQEDLNFLLTNRLPRRLATRFMGWFSRIEQPLVRDLSIATWRLFCDVDLSDAQETRFPSLHAAFVRALRPGARPIEPRIPRSSRAPATRSWARMAGSRRGACSRSRACPTASPTSSAAMPNWRRPTRAAPTRPCG